MAVGFRLFFAAVLFSGWLTAQESLNAQELTTRCDPPAGSLGRLDRTQKEAFSKSEDMVRAGRYADALGELRNVLGELRANSPAWMVLAELTAEAALFAGNRPYAVSLLKPIEEHDGSDCLVRTLLARAYAEDGRSAERDAEIGAVTALHNLGPDSPAGRLDLFMLEQHSVKGGGMVRIWHVLRPLAPHNTYLYAEISDTAGGMILRIEQDSDDGDQGYFREVHPELAAKGDRKSSLDAFAPARTPEGRIDHATIQFFDGKPGYDTVRERILAIAERSAKPAS